MGEVKIVDIRLRPWWKFWKIDSIEVIVEDEGGNRKTLSIYSSPPFIRSIFRDYVEYKYCTGDQFWDLHQRRKKKKLPKVSKEEQILMLAADFIGETFDCAIVMSKEDT